MSILFQCNYECGYDITATKNAGFLDPALVVLILADKEIRLFLPPGVEQSEE